MLWLFKYECQDRFAHGFFAQEISFRGLPRMQSPCFAWIFLRFKQDCSVSFPCAVVKEADVDVHDIEMIGLHGSLVRPAGR